ncbi:hypothetical protein SAMN05444678_1411, partial [Sphingomonas sp. YR710]|uniref:hypothetical protein n=1 Tax=Sphingomonas sp. YR710 TaxID=1882773 RepID=UPI0008878C72
MSERFDEAEPASVDAGADSLSDAPIETIIANLSKRSEADRQALVEALLNGEAGTGSRAVSGLELSIIENKAKNPLPDNPCDMIPGPPPVSGT